jgi:uncharacterized protein (TIGR00299 family) protein
MPEFNKILIIDCQIAGISGDMFLGALVDIGADTNKIISAIKSLENPDYGYKNVKINIQQVMRKEFKATKIDVTAENTSRKNGSTLVEIVEKTSKNLKLSAKAQRFASNVIRTLLDSEMKLHKKSLAEVHLHEVGLVDTPAEIIGATVALEDLGLFNAKIYATPVSVGGGLFKFSHGTVSSPAPATLEIFRSKKFPIKGGPVETELTTPTGASILVNLAHEVSRFYPEITPLNVGYGTGNKDLKEMPNVLRLTVGKPSENEMLKDEVAILETNIDDVTGEIIGNTLDTLLREGAKDVSIIPMFTKKNRPGQILKIVADRKEVKHLSRVIMEETGTLGVRVYPCNRHIINREVAGIDVRVDNVKTRVKVKVAKNSKGKIIRIKPEYEDAKRLAEKTGKPLREINDIITTKAREVFINR